MGKAPTDIQLRRSPKKTNLAYAGLQLVFNKNAKPFADKRAKFSNNLQELEQAIQQKHDQKNFFQLWFKFNDIKMQYWAAGGPENMANLEATEKQLNALNDEYHLKTQANTQLAP